MCLERRAMTQVEAQAGRTSRKHCDEAGRQAPERKPAQAVAKRLDCADFSGAFSPTARGVATMSVVPCDAKAALKTHALQTLRDHATSCMTHRLCHLPRCLAPSIFVTATCGRTTITTQIFSAPRWSVDLNSSPAPRSAPPPPGARRAPSSIAPAPAATTWDAPRSSRA